jgi:hypothetical protein
MNDAAKTEYCCCSYLPAFRYLFLSPYFALLQRGRPLSLPKFKAPMPGIIIFFQKP